MTFTFRPHAYPTPEQTIASILQGEASNQGRVGMQAVANVIANRASRNFNGYGNDFVSQALAYKQFQGQLPPTSASLAVARDLYGGRLNDVTGGALFYANPRGSTPGNWATRLNSGNSLKIGDHYFTDNTSGRPFSGGDLSAQDRAQDFQQDNPGAPTPDTFNHPETVQSPLGDPNPGSPNSLRSMTPDEQAKLQGAPPSPQDTAEGQRSALVDQQGKGGGLTPQTDQYSQSGSAGGSGPKGLWEPTGAAATDYAGEQARKGSEQVAQETKAGAKLTSDTNKADTEAINKTNMENTQAVIKSTETTAHKWQDVTGQVTDNLKDIFQRTILGMTGMVLLLAVAWIMLRPQAPPFLVSPRRVLRRAPAW